MAGRFDDDDYVANLLKQDAKKANKSYELVGIDAFNPRRFNSRAPKPNTNFLRHIIRQTDSHNAALLAKEAEESNTRLKLMDYERQQTKRKEAIPQRNKAEGRLTRFQSDEDDRPIASKQEAGRREHGDERHGRYRRGDRIGSMEAQNRRHRDSSDDARWRKRRHQDHDENHSTRKRKRSRSSYRKEQGRKYKEEEEDLYRSRRREHPGRHRSRRTYSRSPSRSRSRSRTRSDRHKKHRVRNRSRSIERDSNDPNATRNRGESRQTTPTASRRTASPATDSDPLEAIVGPLPPSVQPAVRSRGRGTHKANSMGIDSRFSSTYNPAVDVRPESEAEDDWGDALEALKDRQRWQQQGADRLKAAGFSEAQVKKWERGGEQTEEDVIWTRKGQAREWDRGKVVDEDGDVELKADFGRLT